MFNPYSKFAVIHPKGKLREVKSFAQVTHLEGAQAWIAVHQGVRPTVVTHKALRAPQAGRTTGHPRGPAD